MAKTAGSINALDWACDSARNSLNKPHVQRKCNFWEKEFKELTS